MLLQLPGTLPFAEVKPHTATALEEMIDRLSEKSTAPPGVTENPSELLSDNDMSGAEAAKPPKIGKLRIHKSGKVVLRLELPGTDAGHVDLELNEGIKSNFYQELVAVDSVNNDIHFLAPVQHKIVATPDLESILEGTTI